MQQVQVISKDIKNKVFLPIYFLSGADDFYINQITDALIDTVLEESEKDFNQAILYGKETTWADVIAQARQYPMLAERRLVVLKEAQHLSRDMEQLVPYIDSPTESTILVVCFNGKTPDKRTKLYKSLKKKGWLFESPRIFDNQLPNWIGEHAATMGLQVENKARYMLADFLGMDLSRIHNELEKIKIWTGDEAKVTAALVEKHIGISKDYNTFELQKALANRDYTLSQKIASVMSQNAKAHPLVVTLSVLSGFFTNLVVYHSLADKSQGAVASALRINPFFVSDYALASRSFPLKKVTQIISHLRTADLQSKGLGLDKSKSDLGILKELIYKIFYA